MPRQQLPQGTDRPVIPQPAPESRASLAELFGGAMRKEEERRAELAQVRAEGREALQRLMAVAQRDTGQSRVCATFLLSLYNGYSFCMDLTDLRRLDYELFLDCITVLKMDFQPAQEVHCYFKDGGQLFERLAKDWGIVDFAKVVKQ